MRFPGATLMHISSRPRITADPPGPQAPPGEQASKRAS